MYEADARAGVGADELRSRLQEYVRCARDMLTQRVVEDDPGADTLIDECLTALNVNTRGTPFGRDLAAITTLDQARGTPMQRRDVMSVASESHDEPRIQRR